MISLNQESEENLLKATQDKDILYGRLKKEKEEFARIEDKYKELATKALNEKVIVMEEMSDMRIKLGNLDKLLKSIMSSNVMVAGAYQAPRPESQQKTALKQVPCSNTYTKTHTETYQESNIGCILMFLCVCLFGWWFMGWLFCWFLGQ